MAAKSLVLVGHGMVGHRFVEALRARDDAGQWQVTVLCEEAVPAYDRVGLSSYVGSWDRKELALAGNDYAGRRPGRPAARRARTAHRPRRPHGHDQRAATSSRYDALVLATGSYPFVPPVPGHDLDALLRLPHPRRPRRASEPPPSAAEPAARRASSSAVACSGSRPPTRCGSSGMTPHVVEFAPRLMPLQVDEGGGAVLKRLVSEPRPARAHRRGRPSRSSRDDGRPARRALRRLQHSTRPCSCSPPACAPATDSPATPGLDVGERGGIRTDLDLPHRRPAHLRHRRVRRRRGHAATGSSPRATASPRSSRTGCSAASAEFPGADLSTKLKLLGVDVASFGDAHAATDGRARGRAQRRRQGHLRQARGFRRREDPARRHPRRRRVRLRDAAADGRAPAARRPRRADLPGRRGARRRRPARRRPGLLLQRRQQGRHLRRDRRGRLRHRARSRRAPTPAPPAAAACR